MMSSRFYSACVLLCVGVSPGGLWGLQWGELFETVWPG